MKPVKIPETLYDEAEDVQEEYDYPTLGEAVRHMARSPEGYEV